MSNVALIQAMIDAEADASYDRGVTDGLQHFDRLRAWLTSPTITLEQARTWAAIETERIEAKYPRIAHPSV